MITEMMFRVHWEHKESTVSGETGLAQRRLLRGDGARIESKMNMRSSRWVEEAEVPAKPWGVGTHSFIRHLLNIYYVPGTGIRAVETLTYRNSEPQPYSLETYSPEIRE